MAGRMINGPAALAALVRPAGDTAEPGVHRVLPVVPELSGLLPGHGLRRGSTVAVAGGRSASGSGGTSLLLALLSAASRAGSWCAVVGVPSLGILAAAENGIALDRLALVPHPGPEWPTVVAALIDGVDVVVTAVPGPVSDAVAGRLAARARQRGSVLMPFGHWAGADVTLQVTHGRWEGLGRGRGRLRRRVVTVLARGRGAAARPKETTMWMPGVTLPASAGSPGAGSAGLDPAGPGASGRATPAPVAPGSASGSGLVLASAPEPARVAFAAGHPFDPAPVALPRPTAARAASVSGSAGPSLSGGLRLLGSWRVLRVGGRQESPSAPAGDRALRPMVRSVGRALTGSGRRRAGSRFGDRVSLA